MRGLRKELARGPARASEGSKKGQKGADIGLGGGCGAVLLIFLVENLAVCEICATFE